MQQPQNINFQQQPVIPQQPIGGNEQDLGVDNNMDVNDNMGDEFDTEVDTDNLKDEDPKKYVQQLTGKLSQAIRKYNSTLRDPDVELCKYVSGMVLKQSTEGLTNADKEEILKKVKMDEEEPEEPLDNNNNEEVPQ